MFRRSRFSARPNVGATGRTAQEAPSASQDASETPKDVAEGGSAAVTDSQPVGTPSEKPEAPGDGNGQHGESTGTPAALQRRKRFSIKPKVAPGRPSAVARTQKSPFKAASETPVEVPASGPDKPTTSRQTAAAVAPQRLQSPRRRRSSGESKQPKMQPKQTLVPSDSPEPLAESAENPPADGGRESQSTSDSQVEGVPSKLQDKVPFSILDREAMELSERAKTLVSSKSRRCPSPSAFSLSRLLNDPSDIQRIAKAQKLRDLLKQEMHKDKKRRKTNKRVKEYNLDPAKMTMSELIRYLPESNPMTAKMQEPAPGNETVVPPSPGGDASPERSQKLEAIPKIGTPRQVEEELDDEEEDEDDSVMVPQVKVAEDGTLIIDEESLTVEVQRAKGPNPANDRDPIFERGSTTTYASFRKGTYTKPWSSEETDMFFLAVSMVGTDFSMICQLFPLRARSEIKNKFKKEERENSWRVDKAFRERRKLDIEYFSKLLEKILEVQENRKKLRSLAGKKFPKTTTRKAKGKKATRNLSVVEEEDEEEQNEIAELEEEGEKENEEGADVAKPKKKRKRKCKTEALTEEPSDKKNKMGEKSNEDEGWTPEDTEAALPEDCPTSDMSKEAESARVATGAKIKPAKLSRGRAPKPLLPLGRKWGKKPPPPSTKSSDAAPEEGEEGVTDGGAAEQVDKDASPSGQDENSEEDDATAQPPKTTRYGRLPKPVKPLNYPGNEAAPEAPPAPTEGPTASAGRPSSKCTAKRGRPPKLRSPRESKKPKLVTIVASQSDYSDEEDEKHQEEDVEEEPPGGAPFVPASLRSLRPVMSQVEETLEEDVVDLLSLDHAEVSEDESYNEAAQTLLTIGNLAHLPQSAQDQTVEDHGTGTTLAHVKESIPHLKDGTPALLDENSVAPLKSATADREIIETSDNVTVLHSGGESEDIPVVECCDQRADSDLDPKKGGSSEEKPNPGRASGTSHSKSHPGTSTVRRADASQTTETPSAAEETPSAAEETPSAADGCEKESAGEGQPHSDHSASENRTPYSRSPSGSTAAAPVPHGGAAATESQPGHGPNADSAQVQESGDHPGARVTPVVGQKAERKVGSSPPTRKSRFQKVKPKVNLARTSRTKSQPTKDTDQTPNPKLPEETIAAVEAEPTCGPAPDSASVDLSSAPTATEEQPAMEEKKPDDEVVGRVASGAETSNRNVSENQQLLEARPEPAREPAANHWKPFEEKPPAAGGGRVDPRTASDPAAVTESQVEELPGGGRGGEGAAPACQTARRRLQKPKPKPNVSQAPRTARCKPETTADPVPAVRLGETPPDGTSGPRPPENAAAVEEATPPCSGARPEEPSRSKSAASVTEPSPELRSPPKTTEDMSSTEEQKTDAGRGLGSGQSVPLRRQRFAKVKPNVGSSPRAARAKQQSCDISKPPERCHADPPSETVPPSKTPSPAGPTQSTQRPLAREDCEARSQEENQPAAPNTESPDSRKAPRAVRGRLIRPKPSLARSGRPPLPRQVPETKAAARDFDGPVCHSVSELRPGVPGPAEGAVVQCGDRSSSQNDSGSTPSSLTQVTQHDPPADFAGSSLGCLTRAPDGCTQDASTSITGETQTPNLSVFPDLLLKEVPRDEDEPFFILSLTEIPVTVPEPLPYRPAAEQERPVAALPPQGVVPSVPHSCAEKDFLLPQPSAIGVPGERSAAAACLEGSGETGLVRQDAGACAGLIVEDPAAADVHPSKLADTAGNDGTPPTKADGPRATRRRVKEQVKPRTSTRRQAAKTVAKDEVAPPKALDDVAREPRDGSGHQVDAAKETLEGGGDAGERSGSGAQSARRKGSRNRNPKAPRNPSETIDTAPPPDAPPGKAASEGPEARTPRAAAKRSAPPAASTSREVTRPAEETHPAFTTAASPEVSASWPGDSVEEEPTSVSQYFLCDIFTDVEEG
ncbi:uncharacterized protein LOC120831543 isoform X2 [Gasterosteus aculeatus]